MTLECSFISPSVSGWPAFYQEPVYDLFWINSSTITRRIELSNNYLRWGAWMNIFIEIMEFKNNII